MKKNKKRRCQANRIALASVLTLSANQLVYPAMAVSAAELSYEGTTQMTTEDYTLDVDTFATTLTVEEVYVEAGSQVEAGGKLLKLTSDSYQEALDYYEAAILKAENALTDTQREYDQGVLEAKYTYETAKTKADQAEFVKEYQEKELSDTISDYEEIQEKLEDKISEVKSGISNGSYGSSSSGNSSSAGGGVSTGGADSEETTGTQNGMEGFTDGTTETTTGTAVEPGTETTTGTTTEPGTETTTGTMVEPGTETTTGTMPEPGTETTTGTAVEPGTEATTGTTAEPGTETTTEKTDGSEADDTAEQLSALKEQIEACDKTCSEKLEQLKALLNTEAGNAGDDISDGGNADDGNQDGGNQDNAASQSGQLKSSLQVSIDGDTNVLTNMQNMQTNLGQLSGTVLAEIAGLAGVDAQTYVNLLNNCINQIQADLDAQKTVQAALSELENSGDSDNPGNSGQNIDLETAKTLLNEWNEASQERESLYTQLLSLVETKLESQEAKLASQETENAELKSQLESQKTEIAELKAQLEAAQNSDKKQDIDSTQGSDNAQTPGGTQSSDNAQTPGGTQSSDSTQTPGGTQGSDSTQTPGGTQGSDSTQNSGNTQTPGSTQFPGSADNNNGITDNGSSQNQTGDSSGFPQSGTSTDSTGFDTSGFSLPSGSSSAGASFSASAGTPGTTISAGSSTGMSMSDLNLTEEDISLFGDTYDLTETRSLLDQEPADSTSASNLLEQLEDSADTVATQYAELTRNEKATKLKIQYTYDTSVLSGKLAEITYQETLQEWEDTLSDAKETKSDLEETKVLLESMTDGVVTSENGGTIAAVNYEADDTLSSQTPLVSYYDTDVVTVTIAVPQSEISQMKVGDSVDVTLGGVQQVTGTISEKSLEAEDGTSRTTVNYEVTVSIDNSAGFFSAGTSAVINIQTDEDTEETETAAAESSEAMESTNSMDNSADTESAFETESQTETGTAAGGNGTETENSMEARSTAETMKSEESSNEQEGGNEE